VRPSAAAPSSQGPCVFPIVKTTIQWEKRMSPACMAALTAPAAPFWQALAWPLLLVPLLAAAQDPEPGGPMGQPKDTHLEPYAVQAP
jgi:hypothetical protein